MVSRKWRAQYAEWRAVRQQSGMREAWEKMFAGADNGYKTAQGAALFKADAGNFFFNACHEPVNPHHWDKLLARARQHGFAPELRQVRALFDHAQRAHRRRIAGGL